MARAGNLRDRATFQRATLGADGYGNVVETWHDHLTVWADVLEETGREQLKAGRVEASRMATVRIRQSEESQALTAADRVVIRGQVWNVRSIGAAGRKREMLDLLCETGVAA